MRSLPSQARVSRRSRPRQPRTAAVEAPDPTDGRTATGSAQFGCRSPGPTDHSRYRHDRQCEWTRCRRSRVNRGDGPDRVLAEAEPQDHAHGPRNRQLSLHGCVGRLGRRYLRPFASRGNGDLWQAGDGSGCTVRLNRLSPPRRRRPHSAALGRIRPECDTGRYKFSRNPHPIPTSGYRSV